MKNNRKLQTDYLFDVIFWFIFFIGVTFVGSDTFAWKVIEHISLNSVTIIAPVLIVLFFFIAVAFFATYQYYSLTYHKLFSNKFSLKVHKRKFQKRLNFSSFLKEIGFFVGAIFNTINGAIIIMYNLRKNPLKVFIFLTIYIIVNMILIHILQIYFIEFVNYFHLKAEAWNEIFTTFFYK